MRGCKKGHGALVAVLAIIGAFVVFTAALALAIRWVRKDDEDFDDDWTLDFDDDDEFFEDDDEEEDFEE